MSERGEYDPLVPGDHFLNSGASRGYSKEGSLLTLNKCQALLYVMVVKMCSYTMHKRLNSMKKKKSFHLRLSSFASWHCMVE